MGSHQFIMILMIVVIIAIGIAGAIGVVQQQGIQHEKKILDGLLFEAGSILYEHFLLPTSYGGFGRSVPYMKENSDKVYALLPTPVATLQSMLYMRGGIQS
ncbi:MAG TPA: hypothetical protein ENG70_01880 [Candidatus Cloacimonetes bacterium]|nr:hypothetical protein [Candidatus Cloacimonadota bacterium]HEX37600.1 hypothetical protein [Candidatus Cloacimonadota bacterium]